MGTHPIFESDFDCLTEMRQSLVRAAKKHHGHTPMVGNVGMGRHFDPTKHLTLQEMKNKSVYYNDVYLDGLENSPLMDRNYTRVLTPFLSSSIMSTPFAGSALVNVLITLFARCTRLIVPSAKPLQLRTARSTFRHW